jgi:glycosyltransferase involved in cell wall biosynthesis
MLSFEAAAALRKQPTPADMHDLPPSPATPSRVAGRRQGADKPYRFGFVLTSTIGNMTRYLNLRKYAERDDEVEFAWAPVHHYTPPDLAGPLRFLPGPLLMRARVLQQAYPVLRQLDRLDAVMIHLFEADILCALRSYVHRTPLRISSTDEAPITDRSTYPLYPHELSKPVWRQKMRLSLDLWRIRRTDCFVPFSQWAADILVRNCGVPADRVHALHVGLDPGIWQCRPRPEPLPDARLKLLFVGTDFERKGGQLLLDVFGQHFHDRAELHLVTKQAPRSLPPNVIVHDRFEPNDPALVDLYSQVDVLVIPTTADTGPLWGFMEAMAMGLPVIGTDTGSNTELVRHQDTGLIVRIGDGDDLARAIETLAQNPAMRRDMGERGRQLIATRYNAAINVPRILRVMKDAVDASRRSARKPSSVSEHSA